jgi:protein ImuB
MNRLLVVRCPDLLEEDEDGGALRSFVKVIEVVETYCPWVTTVRCGVCSLPARGPARYFGGEERLVRRVATAAAEVTPVEVGVADGLFAADLAARGNLIIPAGGTADFLAPLPVDVLGHPDLAELLHRLGIRTLGDFAALPEPHVLGRFGADGVACHQVAGGWSGELGRLRQPGAGRRVDAHRVDAHRVDAHRTGHTVAGHTVAGHTVAGHTVAGNTVVGEPEFWGGVSEADARAARALAAVQHLLGPDGVVTARLQGGRGPAQRARFVTWNAQERREDTFPSAPWPGQIPPPAPALVHPTPLPAELADAGGHPVSVSGRGLFTAVPSRLSVEKRPWSALTAWAGPWPSDERWWSRSHRRSARVQAVTGTGAHLLLIERGRWWVEATYG